MSDPGASWAMDDPLVHAKPRYLPTCDLMVIDYKGVASWLGIQIESVAYERIKDLYDFEKICWHCGKVENRKGWKMAKYELEDKDLDKYRVRFERVNDDSHPWPKGTPYTFLCEYCFDYIKDFNLPPIFNLDTTRMKVEESLAYFKRSKLLSLHPSIYNDIDNLPVMKVPVALVKVWKKFIGDKIELINWDDVSHPIFKDTLYERYKTEKKIGDPQLSSPQAFTQWILDAAHRETRRNATSS